MKKLLRIMVLTFAASALLFLGASVASAAEIVDQGNCGKNATWQLDTDGVLTISGTGDMTDWNSSNPPWLNEAQSITQVVINSGITHIGMSSFYKCINLESITIPDSVTSIRSNAFSNCDSLKKVYINDLESYLCIKRSNEAASPTYAGAALYEKGNLVKEPISSDCGAWS